MRLQDFLTGTISILEKNSVYVFSAVEKHWNGVCVFIKHICQKKKKKDVLVGKAFHHLLMGAPDYEQAFMSVAPPVGHGPREGVRVRWPWASMSH